MLRHWCFVTKKFSCSSSDARGNKKKETEKLHVFEPSFIMEDGNPCTELVELLSVGDTGSRRHRQLPNLGLSRDRDGAAPARRSAGLGCGSKAKVLCSWYKCKQQARR